MENSLIKVIVMYLENALWLKENGKITDDDFHLFIENLFEALKEYD